MSSTNLPPTTIESPVSPQAQPPATPKPFTPSKPPASESKQSKPDTHPPRNSFRELVETIVFVTILVLLLKSFVAEAFVIPTGSMAETLLGYRAFVTCPSCGHEFPINMSEEIEPQEGRAVAVEKCWCPNCRMTIVRPPDGGNWVRRPEFLFNCGDRVLVAKWPMQEFHRWDVVVFKYPEQPVKNTIPMNYIKRLVGLPGETIAVYNGDLYVANVPIDYSEQDKPSREEDRGRKPYMFVNAQNAQDAFRAGNFNILQKPPAQMLEMRRIVYDNDHQAADLVGKVEPRWKGDSDWIENDKQKPTSFHSNGDGVHWLRYRHLVFDHGAGQQIPIKPQPELIRNVTGYNSIDPAPRGGRDDEGKFWVGDLLLECQIETTKSAGEVILELSKGPNRFQASFNLTDGKCTLTRVGPVSPEVIASENTSMSKPGKYRIRFANVDQRLTVWVDNKLIFGDGVSNKAGRADRTNDESDPNNLQPASVGVSGGADVTVSSLRLWRDSYYTYVRDFGRHDPAHLEADMTMFIQPGHYLCMGDNSTQSSDGRMWGSVPERLMLGRAVMVYFPVWPFAQRFGPIR